MGVHRIRKSTERICSPPCSKENADSEICDDEEDRKENADNAISSCPTSETENQLGDARTHHGLGEVLPTNDDNTQECAQS